MGDGIRRAHAAFDDADAGFLDALEALRQITLTRGSFEDQLTETRETIGRLEAMVLDQSAQLRQQSVELRELRAAWDRDHE
jgi:hypothetical protein